MSLWVNRRLWLRSYESWNRAPTFWAVVLSLASKQRECSLVAFLSLSNTCHRQFIPRCPKRSKLLPQEPTKPCMGQWNCYLATECSKARIRMLTLPSVRVVFQHRPFGTLTIVLKPGCCLFCSRTCLGQRYASHRADEDLSSPVLLLQGWTLWQADRHAVQVEYRLSFGVQEEHFQCQKGVAKWVVVEWYLIPRVRIFPGFISEVRIGSVNMWMRDVSWHLWVTGINSLQSKDQRFRPGILMQFIIFPIVSGSTCQRLNPASIVHRLLMTLSSECGLSFPCLRIYFAGLVIPLTEYSVVTWYKYSCSKIR